jgi:hypothetical protein
LSQAATATDTPATQRCEESCSATGDFQPSWIETRDDLKQNIRTKKKKKKTKKKKKKEGKKEDVYRKWQIGYAF